MSIALPSQTASKRLMTENYLQDRFQVDAIEELTKGSVQRRNRLAEARLLAAPVYVENWANGSAWTGTATVSNGRMYNSLLNYRLNLAAGEKATIRGTFHVGASSAGTALYMGLSNHAPGVTPNPDQNGIYYYVNNLTMAKFRGTNLTGTEATPFSTNTLTANAEYMFTIVIDEDWISWAISAVDTSYSSWQGWLYYRCKRTDLPSGPAVNQLVLISSGAGATEAAHSFGPVVIHREMGAPVDRNAWTVNGFTLFGKNTVPIHQQRQETTSGNAVRWQLQLPGAYDPTRPVPVVVYMHGADETGQRAWGNANSNTIQKALQEAGYAVIASDNGTSQVVTTTATVGGNNLFGNPTSQADYVRLIEWFRDHYVTGPVFFWTESMGTHSALNLLAYRNLGGVAGAAFVCGSGDISDIDTDPTWGAAALAAYGTTAGAGWDAQMALYNPEGHRPHKYRNTPMRWYVVAGDTVADPNTQVYPFVNSKITGWVPETVVNSVAGTTHLAAAAHQPADVVSFFNTHLDRWNADEATEALAAALRETRMYPVVAATTANITLSGTQTIDGVAVQVGQAVLVKNQTNAYDNGVYTVASGIWTRHGDFATANELAGVSVRVQGGTSNGGQVWNTTFKSTDKLGITNMTWSQLGAGGGSGIPTSTVTTKGDLIAATGSATVTRQGVGADDTALLADSSQATGVRWGFAKTAYVAAATTASITLSGTQTIDGVAVAAGQSVLVKDLVGGSYPQNGVYVVNAGAWTRHPDFDTAAKLAGAEVRVVAGTANGGEVWRTRFKSTDTLGTTAMVWYQATDSLAIDLETEYTNNAPNSPTVGSKLFTRFRARRIPAFVGPTGQDTQLQPSLFTNRISQIFTNPTQATPTYLGVTPTNNAAPTAVTPAAPSGAGGLGASVHRHRYSTAAATAGSAAGFRIQGQQLWFTGAANAGGFFIVMRFGQLATIGRVAFGVQAATAAITMTSDIRGVILNFVGFAKNQADTNFYAYSVGGTAGTNNAVDTGISASVSTSLYEARLFAPSAGGQLVYWSLHEISTNAFAQGSFNTNLPALNTALYVHMEASNGTTASTGSFDLQSLYIETDN